MKLRAYLDENGIKYDWFATRKLGITDTYFNSILNGKKPSKPVINLISLLTDGQVTEADWE